MGNVLKNLFLKIHLFRCNLHLLRLHPLYIERDFTTYGQVWQELINQAMSSKALNAELSGRFPIFFDLIKKAQILLSEQQWTSLEQLQPQIDNALENATVSLPLIPLQSKFRNLLIVIVAIFFIGAAIILPRPLKEKYNREVSIMDLAANQQIYAQKTLDDLTVLKKALDAFYRNNHSYPSTNSTWFGIKSPFGESRADWIPGLAPKYIHQLPADPRKSRTDIQQYMYMSNGKDFKLIAHFPVGIADAIKKHPELVDSKRPSWSIGIWSDSAKTW